PGDVHAELEPVRDAVGQFRRCVERVVRNEAAWEIRLLAPEKGVVEMMLDGPLADLCDLRVVKLDLVDGAGRPHAAHNGDRAKSRAKRSAPEPQPLVAHLLPPPALATAVFGTILTISLELFQMKSGGSNRIPGEVLPACTAFSLTRIRPNMRL